MGRLNAAELIETIRTLSNSDRRGGSLAKGNTRKRDRPWLTIASLSAERAHAGGSGAADSVAGRIQLSHEGFRERAAGLVVYSPSDMCEPMEQLQRECVHATAVASDRKRAASVSLASILSQGRRYEFKVVPVSRGNVEGLDAAAREGSLSMLRASPRQPSSPPSPVPA